MPSLLVVLSNRKRKMRPTEFVRSLCWRHHIAFTPFKKIPFTKFAHFSDIDKKFQNPVLSGGIFTPTSDILAASVLVLMCRI